MTIFTIQINQFIFQKVMTEPPFDDYIANANALQMLILRREAAFLYDAVKLYAAALKEMLLNGEDPMNGKALIQKLFKTHYKSVLGYTVYLDENGDAQGNYTLVALDRKNNLTGTNLNTKHIEKGKHPVVLKYRLVSIRKIYYQWIQTTIDT